jgi:hypothetical protein
MEGDDLNTSDPLVDDDAPAPATSNDDAVAPSASEKAPAEVVRMDARGLDVNKDLQVFVSDPEKHGDGMDAYASYCVTTCTTMPSFESSEFFVRRRFSDFTWLRKQLIKNYPSCIIPPMPSKDRQKQFSRFNAHFLEKRRIYLERFLRRCTTHPQLCHDKDLHKFLEAKKWALESGKKEKGQTISNLKESVAKTYAGLKMKNADERFVNLRSHVKSLSEHLSALEKTGGRLKKHQTEVVEDLEIKYPLFTLLANSENEMSDMLTNIAGEVEQLHNIADLFATNLDVKYVDPLDEYIRYADSATELLKKRDMVEQKFESAQDYLSKKESERQKVQAGEGKGFSSMFSKKAPEVIKQEKLDVLAKQISEGEEKVQETETELKKKNEEVLAEFDLWHKNKVTDLKFLISDYVDTHIDYHEASLELLKKMLPALE